MSTEELPDQKQSQEKKNEIDEYVRKDDKDAEEQTPNPNDSNPNSKGKKEYKKNYNKDNDYKNNRNREDRPKKNRETMKQKYERWEQEMTVTLDSPLPEMPKEKITEPSNDDFNKERKAMVQQIKDKKDLISKLKEERAKAIDADKKERAKNQGDLKSLFDEARQHGGVIGKLAEEKKVFMNEMDNLMREKEILAKQCFGKKITSVKSVNEKIDDLDYRQKTEKLTAQEERVILKDMKELKQTLPILEEVEVLEAKLKEIKEKKKEIGKKMKEAIDLKDQVNKRIDEVKAKKAEEQGEKNNEIVEKKPEEKRTKHPITLKIEAIYDTVDGIKKDIEKKREDHEGRYKAWKEQNEMEDKIKWIKRKKDYLKREKAKAEELAEIEKEKKAEEDRIKAEEEMFGKYRKFQPQMNICDNLINFLKAMHSKENQANLEEDEWVLKDEKEVKKDVSSGEWKKAKVEVYQKKTYYDDESKGVQPGNKKKNKRNKNKNKKQGPNDEEKLTLNLETLNYFDEVKVSPPQTAKDIDAIMVKLQEKKQHFAKISDELNEPKDKKKEEAPKESEEKKEKKEETKENGESNEEAPKEEVAKKQKKQKINLDDEEMFPSI